MAAGWVVLRHTRYGLIARGTMQNAAMAAALGISPPTVYAVTFGVGAALSGLAARCWRRSRAWCRQSAPPTSQGLHHRRQRRRRDLSGTAVAASLLGGINTAATFAFTPVIGEVALLVAAVILLRILPQGITGRFLRRSI